MYFRIFWDLPRVYYTCKDAGVYEVFKLDTKVRLKNCGCSVIDIVIT